VSTVRIGGSRRPLSLCLLCRNCKYQQTREYSAAQDAHSPSPHRPTPSHRRSTFSRRSTFRLRHTRSPKRDTSSGPPQLWGEEAQKEGTSKNDGTESWDEAQAQFGLGAGPMSQGSGSPVAIFDAETCDQLIQNLRGVDGKLPDFESAGSDPGSPPLALEAEVAHGEKAAQTSPTTTQDQSIYVVMAPPPVSTADQSTQVLSRPHQATSGTQTPSLALTSECKYKNAGPPSPSTISGLRANGHTSKKPHHVVVSDVPDPSEGLRH